jgi:hypothetical protein
MTGEDSRLRMNHLRKLRLAAVMVLAAALLSGCGDDEEPTGPEIGEGDVRGNVTFAKTGEGIANLVVALSEGGTVLQAAATDAVGEFSFSDVPPGRYLARLTGFELATANLRNVDFTPVEREVEVGDQPAELVFAGVVLIPPRITGTVRCGGAAVPDAQVRVIGGETDATVATDAQGRYAATDLSQGHFAVIPLAPPCSLSPPFGAIELRPGQSGEVSFEG